MALSWRRWTASRKPKECGRSLRANASPSCAISLRRLPGKRRNFVRVLQMRDPTLGERITASFYAWELRGRGWQLSGYPVELEPPFRRCSMLPQFAPPPVPFDDGKRPTLLSSLVDEVRGLFVRAAPALPVLASSFEEQEPFPASDGRTLVTLL